MHSLPDEVVLVVLSYLAPTDITSFQCISRRSLRLGRDDRLWKAACFDDSKAQAIRRRDALLESQSPSLRALRDAVNDLPQLPSAKRNDDLRRRASALPQHNRQSKARARALASWDPSRPREAVDYYQEYMHRHGPISLDWMQSGRDCSQGTTIEARGVGTLSDAQGRVHKAVAPLDDGSIAIWELSRDAESSKEGRIAIRSAPGLLDTATLASGSSPVNNESGAIDSVSIDNARNRAYFAVQDHLNEVDLDTSRVVRRERFPFPITCLSGVSQPNPLTVGTAMTMHLYDTRDNRPASASDTASSSARTELINGPSPISPAHALLSQPGPLSILHDVSPGLPDNVWVAGRFASILCYDRRFWPRINQTIFSGGRLSSLTSLPFGWSRQNADLTGRDTGGLSASAAMSSATLIAAGQYKGKGSLELYGLCPQASGSIPSTQPTAAYRNRQTASRSRLLSVSTHGARVVFSDGDGGLKWVERDGISLVRAFNINDYSPTTASPQSRMNDTTDSGYASRTPSPGPASPAMTSTQIAGPSRLFAENENSTGDIVQKIIPVRGNGDTSHEGYRTCNRDDLLIWTGDGRLGLVGFRGRSAFENSDAEATGGEDEQSASDEQQRLFEARMRRALERQADDIRFVRGLGLA